MRGRDSYLIWLSANRRFSVTRMRVQIRTAPIEAGNDRLKRRPAELTAIALVESDEGRITFRHFEHKRDISHRASRQDSSSSNEAQQKQVRFLGKKLQGETVGPAKGGTHSGLGTVSFGAAHSSDRPPVIFPEFWIADQAWSTD